MSMHSPIHSPEPFVAAEPNAASTLPAIIDALPDDFSRVPQHQFTRARQAAFLKLLADSGEVRVAARASNVSHQTVYRMRRSCQTFRAGWDAALLVARERAEEALATRAMHGVEEQVFYHGEVVATRRRYDSRLLLAHLARLDRLSERADVADLAGMFDDVVEAFEQAGEGALQSDGVMAGEEVLPQDVEVVLPEVAPEESSAEGSEKASGPCNMRSKSPAKSQREGDADGATAEPTLNERIKEMERNRPYWSTELADLTYDMDVEGEIALAQLAAFEAGQDKWWEVMPEGLDLAEEAEMPREPLEQSAW